MKTTIPRTTQKQNNISTGNKDSVNEYFTLKQCADYLQVNPATVRNWTKLNKIEADAYNGRQPLFLCHKIEAFKSALLNNKISSLKSRRNKSYKKNSELYSAYLKKDSKNTVFCNNLIKFDLRQPVIFPEKYQIYTFRMHRPHFLSVKRNFL